MIRSRMRALHPVRFFLISAFVTIFSVLAGLAQAQGLSLGTDTSSSTTESSSDSSSENGALQSLLDVLQDDAARAELIEKLETVVNDSAQAADDAADTVADAAENQESIGTQIAQFTQGTAETIAARVTSLYATLTGSSGVLRGLTRVDTDVLWQAVQSLFLVIIITVAVFMVLRRLMMPFFRSMGERAEHRNILHRAFLFLGSIFIDAMIVVVAWGIGYAITLLALGETAQIGFRQTLYLNAFLIVELIKVAIRSVISPSAGGLRPVNLSNVAAKRINLHSNIVVSILGYGQLLVIPIINRNVGYTAGLAVSALLSLIVLFYVVFLVIYHRDTVANWIARRMLTETYEEETDDAPKQSEKYRLRGVFGTLVRSWHWFALIYLAVMFTVIVSSPSDVVVSYLAASGKVLLAVLVGSMIVSVIGQAMLRGISLPDDLKSMLPTLEPRLNSIVPKILLGLRIIVTIAVVAYALNIMGLTFIGSWLSSASGLQFSGAVVSVGMILLVAAAIWLAFNSWLEYKLNPDYGRAPTVREKTLLSLLKNAFSIALFVLTAMFCLSEIGLNIGPLIASAGVLGLAIGFGAQKLVQDIITGVFIQFENAMNVGDVVTVGGTTGTVEKLTVRSVSLRDVQGAFHIIPFSSVDMVTNFMREFSYFVCDMGVAYRENVSDVKKAMFDAFEELKSDEEIAKVLLGDLEWFGLNSFGDSAIVLRARIKTIPGSQWSTGRAYNEILKRIFDEQGIEIPYPYQTIVFGETKEGETQPIRLSPPSEDKDEGAKVESKEQLDAPLLEDAGDTNGDNPDGGVDR